MPKQVTVRRRQKPTVPLRVLWIPVAAMLGIGALVLSLRGDNGPVQPQPRPAPERTESKVLAIQTEPIPIARQMEGQTGVVRVVITDAGFEPPLLTIQIGGRVKIHLKNEASREQNFLLPRFGVVTSSLAVGGENYIEFTANEKGEWAFFSDQVQEGAKSLTGILKVE